MNPRSTDWEADALATTPSRQLQQVCIFLVFTKSHDLNNVSMAKQVGPSLKYG